jgi:voltage-gated potassium channel
MIVLQVESQSPDANITRGGDALWWGLVTITTVGYGDFFPVTMIGRLTGAFVMFAGVGIIGALASILASLLVAPPTPAEPVPDADPATSVASSELVALRLEIEALRSLIARGGTPSD